MNFAKTVRDVAKAISLEWYNKVRIEGQNFLEAEGFKVEGPNIERIKEMHPKGNYYPFIDELIGLPSSKTVRFTIIKNLTKS